MMKQTNEAANEQDTKKCKYMLGRREKERARESIRIASRTLINEDWPLFKNH